MFVCHRVTTHSPLSHGCNTDENDTLFSAFGLPYVCKGCVVIKNVEKPLHVDVALYSAHVDLEYLLGRSLDTSIKSFV